MKRRDVIRGKGKLGRRMEKALWRWTYFVDRYCYERWRVDEDNPYWHNERGSLGILAAAIYHFFYRYAAQLCAGNRGWAARDGFCVR